MRLAVWEFDGLRWPKIESVICSCGAQFDRLQDSHIDKTCDLAQCHAAIVALHDASDDDDPSLDLVSEIHAAGLTVIVHGSRLDTWPVRAKCRALLAGAGALLDNSNADFERTLQAALAQTLDVLQRERDDERRLRDLAIANGIVGGSASLMEAFRQVVRLSGLSDLPVLIYGDSGTGKELFASAIHALDPKRCDRELVAINCAAINASVAESELFGHVRGAFTGAHHDHGGLFGAADGGVLFLDEIGELSPDIQAKLLRVLQEKKVRRVGTSSDRPIDVRVIAATNRDLPKMVQDGKFRGDLYHRLNALSIRISPLRERSGDLPALIEHFVHMHDACSPSRAIDPDFIDAVSRLELPGNVRELQNLVTTSLAMKNDGSPLGLKDLPSDVWKQLLHSSPPATTPAPQKNPADQEPLASVRSVAIRVGDRHQWNLGKCLSEFEREIVIAAMIRMRNNQSQAARLLGLTSRSIYNKLRKHNLLGKSVS